MKKRLLIVDDDEGFRNTLKIEFAERGYFVFCAESISSAQRLLDVEQNFDFAIVDLRLKSEFSLNFLKELTATNRCCRTVVLTGYPSTASTVQAIKNGAVNYLLKPSSVELIEQALWLDNIGTNFNFEVSDENLATLAQYEYELIEFILMQCNGNITHAAQRLGLHRQSLQRKIRKGPPKRQ
ncbi:MAG: response regulator [Proteobacteria bacterium]|nr:response regulator [Pseudomonadota bacterium]